MALGCKNRETAIEPIKTPDCSTCIRAGLLEQWASVAGDPAAPAVKWLMTGAPAGITQHDATLNKLWPQKTEETPTEHIHLDPDEAVATVSDQDMVDLIKTYRDKGFVKVIESRAQLEQEVGAKYTISKLLGITKQRWDAAAQNYVSKTRSVLDLKSSGISAATSLKRKGVMPRVTDAIRSLLDLIADVQPGETVEQMVIDIIDAFWLVPNNPHERKFFVTQVAGKYVLFLRTAQGSRCAGLTWGTIAALVCRCITSLFVEKPTRKQRTDDRIKMQIYVDDPWSAARGTPAELDTTFAMVVVTWMALGFPLAFHKALRGAAITWIGVRLIVCDDGVQAEIMAEQVQELTLLTEKFRQGNVVSRKELRSYTGKLESVASLLYTVKPFVQPLWAAVYADAGGAPLNCVWTSMIRPSLDWPAAFLAQESSGPLLRRFRLNAHLNTGIPLRITADASPWGIGGFLSQGTNILAYFHDAISADDQEILGCPTGTADGQQLWECLATLVALRCWRTHWCQHRVRLEVRADNITTLTMVRKLRVKGPGLIMIAQDMALDVARSTFEPDVCMHTPGVQNVLADLLSRIHEPGQTVNIPTVLKDAPQTILPHRDRAW